MLDPSLETATAADKYFFVPKRIVDWFKGLSPSCKSRVIEYLCLITADCARKDEQVSALERLL